MFNSSNLGLLRFTRNWFFKSVPGWGGMTVYEKLTAQERGPEFLSLYQQKHIKGTCPGCVGHRSSESIGRAVRGNKVESD